MIGMSETDFNLQRKWHNNITDISVKDIDNKAVADEIRALFTGLTEDEKTRLNKTPESIEGEIKWVTDPWHRYATKYDAVSVLSQVKCPVLAINGSLDTQVPADENLAGIEKGLMKGNNTSYMIKKLDGLNHLFQTAVTGDESEYMKIDETMSPIAMGIIFEWIKMQM